MVYLNAHYIVFFGVLWVNKVGINFFATKDLKINKNNKYNFIPILC